MPAVIGRCLLLSAVATASAGCSGAPSREAGPQVAEIPAASAKPPPPGPASSAPEPRLEGPSRQADRALCDEIVTTMLTLRLKAQGVTDPSAVDREMRARGKQTLIEHCIGRDITESELRCLRAARTDAELEERCLR